MSEQAIAARASATVPAAEIATRANGATLLDAAPRVASLKATAQLLNGKAPASQPRSQPAGPALNALLDELAAAAAQAAGSGPEGRTDAAPLLDRVHKLRALAESADEAGKRQLLDGLRAELGHAGPAATLPSGGPPVQRVSEVALAVGTLLFDLGAIVATVWYSNRQQQAREAALRQQEDAVRDAGQDQAIPHDLTDGVDELDTKPAKAARIFANINQSRFRYTGQFVRAPVAFGARQGDCQTLVDMFIAVCAHFGIHALKRAERRRMLVASRPIHGRNTVSNTEDGSAWFFDEHFWAAFRGTRYDLLFMASPPPQPVLWQSTQYHHNVGYFVFSDGRCLIDSRQPYMRRPIRGEGRIFPNAAAAQAFIDRYHGPPED